MTHYLPAGFRFAGVSAGIKKKTGAKDVCLIVSDAPCTAAGVYTQNQVVAAPVLLCRERTPTAQAQAIVVNSGNANACTGVQGDLDARRMCELASSACNGLFSPESVLVMSTGVIGHKLPMQTVEQGIHAAASQLGDSQQHFLDAADGILTTDVARKTVSRALQLGEHSVHLAGMAKGAGMIGPNMATMLCCVLTDAALSPEQAQRLLKAAADKSFNNISVEGHTSTNDSMILLASGKSHPASSSLSSADEAVFAEHLEAMCIELAKMIPTDGEGSSHLIEISVRGAVSDAEARKISHTVASSNLVKTAVFGNDPNWGRIVSAAGYADATVDASQLQLQVNSITLFDHGEPVPFDKKTASESIRNHATTRIELIVGTGPGACTHWTSDLSVKYVEFNSEYTT